MTFIDVYLHNNNLTIKLLLINGLDINVDLKLKNEPVSNMRILLSKKESIRCETFLTKTTLLSAQSTYAIKIYII